MSVQASISKTMMRELAQPAMILEEIVQVLPTTTALIVQRAILLKWTIKAYASPHVPKVHMKVQHKGGE